MRYVIAIMSGALIAVVPPLLMLVFPEVAWDVACGKVLEDHPASWRVGADLVENHCVRFDESIDSLSMLLLIVGMLTVGCVMSGALAARLAEERRMVVAFIAPFLGYVMLLLSLGGPHSLLSAAMTLVIGVFSGLLGIAGASWRRLTNAWSATRSKQRAPQAQR